MIFAALLASGLTLTPPASDPFAVPKVTLGESPRSFSHLRLAARQRPRVGPVGPQDVVDKHDPAVETSGPVLRVLGRGVMHCHGHKFDALEKK